MPILFIRWSWVILPFVGTPDVFLVALNNSVFFLNAQGHVFLSLALHFTGPYVSRFRAVPVNS